MSELPKATILGPEEIDMSKPIEIDLTKLHEQWRHTKGAQHVWVIGAVYVLEDPEMALDNMVLDAANLAGFQPIHCLWCAVHYKKYKKDIRLAECLGKPE